MVRYTLAPLSLARATPPPHFTHIVPTHPHAHPHNQPLKSANPRASAARKAELGAEEMRRVVLEETDTRLHLGDKL